MCTDRSTWDIAQYIVVTPAPYALFTEKATTEVRAAMDYVAEHSTLPQATSTVRLYDYGIVKSVTPRADGSSVIAVDRLVMGVPNANPETYSYSVPAGTPIFGSGGQAVSVGMLSGKPVDMQTDGVVVVNIFVG